MGFIFPPNVNFQMLGHQTKVSTLRGMKRKAPVDGESNSCCRRRRLDLWPDIWSSLTIYQPSPRQDSLSGEPGPILGNLILDRSDISTMGLQVVVLEQPPNAL